MPEKPKLCYNVKEAARLMGIGVNSMYDLIHADGFPVVWASPRRAVIPCDKLHEWLDAQAGIKRGCQA